jgi:hypothetical protein
MHFRFARPTWAIRYCSLPREPTSRVVLNFRNTRSPLQRARWERAIPLGGTFRHRSPAAASGIVPKTPRDHLLSARECAAASALSMAAFIFGACPCAARRGGIPPAYCRPATSLSHEDPICRPHPDPCDTRGRHAPSGSPPSKQRAACRTLLGNGERRREGESEMSVLSRIPRYARCLARKENLSSRRCSGGGGKGRCSLNRTIRSDREDNFIAPVDDTLSLFPEESLLREHYRVYVES